MIDVKLLRELLSLCQDVPEISQPLLPDRPDVDPRTVDRLRAVFRLRTEAVRALPVLLELYELCAKAVAIHHKGEAEGRKLAAGIMDGIVMDPEQLLELANEAQEIEDKIIGLVEKSQRLPS